MSTTPPENQNASNASVLGHSNTQPNNTSILGHPFTSTGGVHFSGFSSSSFLPPISIKLDRSNYTFWKSQVLPALRAQDLEGYILGSKICPPQYLPSNSTEPPAKNPAHTTWIRTDQSILSWLLNSISETMFGHVVNCHSSLNLWNTLNLLFTTSSKARTLQLRFQLQTLKKGEMTIHDYILKMKSIAENLSAAGQLISDEDLVLYILGGLDHEYDSVVVNLTSRHDQITLQEVQYMLQSQEMRLEQLTQNVPSVNIATQFKRSLNLTGNSPNSQQGNYLGNQSHTSYGGRSYSFRGGRGRGRGGRRSNLQLFCQICNKTGHTAAKCYHRYDVTFQTSHQHSPYSSSSTGSRGLLHNQALLSTRYQPQDNAWYIDSGATTHVTPDAGILPHKIDFKGSENEDGSTTGAP